MAKNRKKAEGTPLCPSCNSPGVKKGFRQGSDIRRFKCTSCGTWYTDKTAISTPESNVDPESVKDRKRRLDKLKREKPDRVYLITSAQNATPIFEPFLRSMEVFCKDNNAELIAMGYRYKNPSSLWTASQEGAEWWDPSLVPHLLDGELELCPNLKIMGNVHITPTASNPLSGLESITQEKSGIFPHAKLEVRMIPTPQNRMPKIITTTGTCTVPNYTDSKAGIKGEFHHVYGALVIEVRGKKFFMRQVLAEKDGSFIDLNREYTPEGSREAPQPHALVLGDIHVQRMDEPSIKATFVGKNSMVHTLKPKRIIYHDLIDFESRSPHEPPNKFFRNYKKWKQNRDDVKKEIEEGFAFLDKYSPEWATNIVVASNHSSDHFVRWLDGGVDPRQDPKNSKFFFETMAGILQEDGEFRDPVDYWAEEWLGCYDRTSFLERDQSYMVGGKNGIELAYHGDGGINGSRGNLNQYSKLGVRTVIGHSHTAGIKHGAVQVGTLSQLDMEYNRGNPDTWIHANCVVYGNAGCKRSLLFIIDGEW